MTSNEVFGLAFSGALTTGAAWLAISPGEPLAAPRGTRVRRGLSALAMVGGLFALGSLIWPAADRPAGIALLLVGGFLVAMGVVQRRGGRLVAELTPGAWSNSAAARAPRPVAGALLVVLGMLTAATSILAAAAVHWL